MFDTEVACAEWDYGNPHVNQGPHGLVVDKQVLMRRLAGDFGCMKELYY